MYKVLQGDVRKKLQELDAGSIQCVVTSPPYYNLRDYGTGEWIGGNLDCDHLSGLRFSDKTKLRDIEKDGFNEENAGKGTPYKEVCGKCGAKRKDEQIGLEKTPQEYVQSLVETFREVRRVLRDDGTVWLNLGDSYAQSGGSGSGEYQKNHTQFGKVINSGTAQNPRSAPPGLKPKDLIGIPWRVAFALQDDGWYLRSDIIWDKKNPMPESVTDRPTRAHEYIFLLSKNKNYYYDYDAIKEPQEKSSLIRALSNNHVDQRKDAGKIIYKISGESQEKYFNKYKDDILSGNPPLRNKRTVWNVAVQPYKGAHFAVFPANLILPCILAGSSHKACEICGSPWERVLERKDVERVKRTDNVNVKGLERCPPCPDNYQTTKTTGWQPTCSCDNKGEGRSVVLDPFAGSGTTLFVSEENNRDSVGIELNPEYIKLIDKRMSEIQHRLNF